MTRLLYGVYGASGCGRGVLPLARAQLEKLHVPPSALVFIDDAPPSAQVNGHSVLTFEGFLDEEADEKHVCLAIADGQVREGLSKRCAEAGLQTWMVMAENVVLMDDVEIGEGAILSPFVVLTSNIRIGRHFHANLRASVEHDCVIGDFVTFAPGATCNGNVVIEDHAYVGSGALIRQGKPGRPLTIGRGAVIGMGAVVTRSVPPGTTVVGNPARPRDGGTV